jgi:hypothetical protein
MAAAHGGAGSRAREEAARLRARAERYERGAEGEERTHAVLAELVADGYVLLDDLAIPGSKANIDHVLVGPAGVFVIDSKHYSGRLSINRGTLWHNQYPQDRELADVRREVDAVVAAMTAAGLATAWIPVHPYLCVHGTDVPGDPDRILGGILLSPAAHLAARIRAMPRVVPADEASRVVDALIARLGPNAATRGGATDARAASLPARLGGAARRLLGGG